MTTMTDRFNDLLTQKKAFASLATLMPDGTPQVTPVWFDYVDGKIRVNTAKGRVKDKNMRANKNVALSILDPDNPYRYLQIRGQIVNVTEDGADDHIDALTKKYIEQDKYPFRQPGEVRVIYEIEPSSWQGTG